MGTTKAMRLGVTPLGIAATALWMLGAMGCGDDRAPAPGVADAGREPGFAADALATGPRMWIAASEAPDATWTFEAWAADLGAVFGLGAHIEVDGAQLEPLADGSTGEAGDALAAAGAAGELALFHLEPTGAAFGATLPSPETVEVSIDSPVRLAALHCRVLSATSARVALSRAFARRSDGTYVALGTAGGVLTTEGDAR